MCEVAVVLTLRTTATRTHHHAPALSTQIRARQDISFNPILKHIATYLAHLDATPDDCCWTARGAGMNAKAALRLRSRKNAAAATFMLSGLVICCVHEELGIEKGGGEFYAIRVMKLSRSYSTRADSQPCEGAGRGSRRVSIIIVACDVSFV